MENKKYVFGFSFSALPHAERRLSREGTLAIAMDEISTVGGLHQSDCCGQLVSKQLKCYVNQGADLQDEDTSICGLEKNDTAVEIIHLKRL
jgi:hypothetical protein